MEQSQTVKIEFTELVAQKLVSYFVAIYRVRLSNQNWATASRGRLKAQYARRQQVSFAGAPFAVGPIALAIW